MKSKISMDIIEKYCRGLRIGLRKPQAANRAGVGYATILKWKKKAVLYPSSLYGELVSLERLTISETESELLKSIRGHMAKDWKAASWLLAKRFPERYAEKIEISSSMKSAGFDMTNEELEKRIEHLRKMMRVK